MADEIVNVNEFQELARQALPKMYYDFYAGGAEDEHTLKKNVQEFQRIILLPRVLVDVSNIALSTNILGYTISSPIMIAPTAMHKLAHPEGELATARAAAACNTIMILSFTASCSVEEVAASCDAVRFFQLYVYKRRDIAVNLVQRAEKSGYKAIVLTADTPRLGRREADIKNKLIVPQLKNLEGLMSTEVVSTHRSELLQDKGSNLEAYANETMDPSFCWRVGRPVIYGLAAKGEAGVRKVMRMLKDELELTMALAGCPSVKDISRSHVRTDRDRLQSML
ncbi:hypothetical protein POTOM_011691 [Populus tomentosa]|uniref:FMN hydroxy acid dehydrogenase domain-containing protein n=1 Tax=Populus tomentosa TaxID=118781 RepID=A0A8X8A876_POPTO|nr:hypothetical protein POTOM_011691 [Populus tomentosa]